MWDRLSSDRAAVAVQCALALVVIGVSLVAAINLQAGLDYFADPSDAIDSLVRGDATGFFASQPLMGPVSLVLRAPFVALAFRSTLDAVYFLGVIPCLVALVVYALALGRRMERAGRPAAERLAVLLLCVGSPVVLKAIHWGHPEEFLCAVLCLGAVLAAGGDRPVWAGLLLGFALGTKQWALLAGLPALAVLSRGHRRFLIVAVVTTAALTLPMLLGNPDRFFDVLRAAGSVDPALAFGQRTGPIPGAHVMPFNVWRPFAFPAPVDGHVLYFMNPTLGRLTHPAILLAGFPLTWALWRRTRSVTLLDGVALLALLFALRCVIDPMSLDYYHVPLVLTLATLAALGSRREMLVALATSAGLGLAFVEPAINAAQLQQHAGIKCAAYLLTMLPLMAWLGLRLYRVKPLPAVAAILQVPPQAADTRTGYAIRLR